jgi:Lrp/AsnC family leucine-responsive transcriptional regulator
MDVRILRFLSLNGAHYPDAEIAKKLRLNSATVNYKIRKLEEEDVIRAYKYRFNPFKLGYRGLAFCFLTIKPNRNTRLMDILMEDKSIVSVTSIGGDFDFVLKFYYKGAKDLNRFLANITSKLKGEVDRVHTRIVTRPFKLHQVALSERDLEPTKLTEKDKRILKYLLKHPDAQRKKIAHDLKMHRNTVSTRIKKMFEERVILKKSVVINPEFYKDIGTALTTLMMVDAEMGAAKKLGQHLAGFGEIHELFSIAYPCDLMAVVRTNEIRECYNFTRNLYDAPELVKTRTILVFDTTAETSLV